ncbi:MAG: hypothetical protein P1U58_02175 [Verrucomicrobiales bacterium]|nr:hypothetical protein [Verrucomicrobiales bacterium]
MTSRPLFFLLVPVLVAGSFFTMNAEAQFGFRPNRINDTLRRQERRQLYRPNVHITRNSSGSRIFKSGSSIPYEYRTRQGFVSKIEIRSGLKIIKTIHLPASSAGRGRFTLTATDFAKAGKTGSKLKFKLWGWQGRNGMQSVHGESISYTLIP